MAGDVTDRERGGPLDPAAELPDPGRRLRDAARRDALLADIARDLHEPLADIRAALRRIASGAAGTRDLAELEAIARQVARLATLQQDLAELHDLAMRRTEPRRSRTDLCELCSRVADAVEPLARDHGVGVDRDIPDDPVTAIVDGERLRQAVEELAARAAAGAPRGARIAVRARKLPGGGLVRIELLPPAGAHAPPPLLPGGAVSLALCRELVEQNGGVLQVAPGRAEISLTEDGRAADAGVDAAAPAAAGGRPRILVVEDDDASREALTDALAVRYDVEPAADGLAGVEAARARRPDLVLMDLFLPRLDGFAALEVLRTDPATADVPVILVSGRGDDLTRARSLDLGAIDFLQKPFSERELRARIERTLRLARRQSQLQALAETDSLTGLANRRAFRSRLGQEVKRARRYGTPLSCVMIDMDHLKPVNDMFGHECGDRAIAAFAEVLRGELRETDFAARFGGDEFVVLLPHTAAAEGRALAQRICDRVREASFEAGGAKRKLEASFGVAELPEGPADEAAEALLRHADAALYDAKNAGRGQVALRGIDGAPSPPA